MRRHWRKLTRLLAVFALGLGIISFGASNAGAISPVFDCFERDGTAYTAYFGYDNDEGISVNIPIGSANQLSTGDTVQPTNFTAGRHRSAFSVRARAGGTIRWYLDGNSASATSNDPAMRCTPDAAASGGGPAPLASAGVTVLALLGLAALTSRIREARTQALVATS